MGTRNPAVLCRVIVESVREVLNQQGKPVPEGLGPSTSLAGAENAVLDSLGFVMLLVEVEKAIEKELGVTVALAGDSDVYDATDQALLVQTLIDKTMTMLNRF